jgi:hypothetical protein
VSRLRAWWWRRRHAPFDWHIACPELLEPCHVLADRERVTRESGRLWDARLDGWARKVYGVDWDYHYDYHSVRESFERWRDDR